MMKRIDFHVHNLPPGRGAVPSLSVEEHLAAGISRMVMLGDVLRYGFHPSPEQVHEINLSSSEDAQRFGDVADFFCFINPENPPDSIWKRPAVSEQRYFSWCAAEDSGTGRVQRIGSGKH
ncbi:MAG: hypothetical protein PHS41_12870 [Victivallaceae bacterium]|nr:hypothetical protein [Victivallaceae bacterium]